MLAQTFTAFAAWWRGYPEEALRGEEMLPWIDITEEMLEGGRSTASRTRCWRRALLVERARHRARLR